jgi:tRNA-splicing ligase RtcB
MVEVKKDEKMQVPLKAWIPDCGIDEATISQMRNICSLPFVFKHAALMPDGHLGKGSAIGAVVPTKGAIIPAVTGVDLGCGMMAVQTTLDANHLPDNLRNIRRAIEKAIPHGRTDNGGKRDKGAWGEIPRRQIGVWRQLEIGYKAIIEKYPKLDRGNHVNHLGTLGGGNHFIEVCLDEDDQVWFMLHSGSRGVGNRIGTFFIEMAKNDMRAHIANLPDKDLAYFNEGTEHFDDYVEAVSWAQEFAMYNRKLMMEQIVDAVADSGEVPGFELTETSVNCHHNYVAIEEHYGEEVFVTRKGAVRARKGDMGIIPGSMGARSYIVRGLGNDESFHSCSHGAGRAMSRNEAKRRFTTADHEKATAGIECRKDEDVIDETPAAYKDIESVMKAQSDLVEIAHTLRQVVCVKG